MADADTDDPLVGHFGAGGGTPVTQQSNEDPLTGHFAASQKPVGDTSFEPEAKADWSDVGKGLSAGYHSGVVAPLEEARGALPAGDEWSASAQEERAKAGDIRQSMTPGAEKTWSVWGAEQAPGLAAMAGPALLGGALAGPAVGIGLAVGSGAAVQGGAAISDVKGAIENAPDEDLQKNNPTYAEYRQTMSEADAKAKLGADLAPSVGIPSAILGGALGGAGGVEMGGVLTKLGVDDAIRLALTGKGPVQNLVTGAGRGLVEAGVPGAAQEEVTQHNIAQAGAGEEPTAHELITAGVNQGLFGAAMAGSGGLFHAPRKLDQAPGEARVARDPPLTNYKKPDVNVPGATVDDVPEAQKGPPPAPAQVDPSQEAALSPAATAPEVTPRVTNPPDKSVIQPEVVQPEAPPVSRGSEAPPAGDTTGPLSPPQKIADAGPAPVPASPREDLGVVQREPDATLLEQHAALLDRGNPRDAMVWPKEVQALDIPKKGGAFGTTTLDDGRIVQFSRNGPNKLYNSEKVKYLERNGGLNDLLQLGPVNKDEAVARVAAGEPGVGVTERTPEGVEVKAAAGTPTTVPDQVAALEASKTPGNTVQVEHPDTTIGDRIARTAQEQQAAPHPMEPLVTPESKPLLPVGQQADPLVGRILAYESPEVRQSYADRLKEKQAAKVVEQPQRQHTAKAAQAKLASDNLTAERIAATHPQVGPYDEKTVLARAKQMVADAKAEKLAIPKVFAEGHKYNPAMLKLREATDLLDAKTGSRQERMARFMDREHMIDTNRHDEAYAARRNEGALGLGSPEGAVETGRIDDTEKPEDIKEAASEPEIVHEAPTEHTSSTEHEANDNQPTRERPAVVQEAKEGEHYTAAKSATGFQVAKVKNRSIRRQDLDEQHLVVTDKDGNPTGVASQRSGTVADAIDEHFDPKRYSPELRPMMERLKDAVKRVAGDTPVHYISHDDMMKLGERARGVYDPNENHVLLNADKMTHDTALHEAFHAATAKALDADPELRGLMDRLQKEMGTEGDSEEFLTRLMTDNKLQDQFKSAKISPELAKDIGIPKWRKATMWEGALNLFRRALGLGPRDVSAIEAAMAVSEKAMWKRDPGMAMEAGGRSLGLRFQKDVEDHVNGQAKDAQEATEKGPDFWKGELATAGKSGASEKAFNGYLKGADSDTLRIGNEHLFGRRDEKNPFRRVQEGLEKQTHAIRKMLGDRDPLMRRMSNMKRQDPDGLQQVVHLLQESSDFGVHPDHQIGVGDNAFIKSKHLDERAAEKHHEAILAHPRLSEEYDGMSGTKQELFRDLRDAMADEGQKAATAHVKTLTDAFRQNFAGDEKLQAALAKPEANRSPAEIKQVERYEAVSKALDGEKLSEEQAEKFNDDPQIAALREARTNLKQEGPYFPGSRKGGYVVNAEHELPEAPNALSVKDNEVTFATKKEAFDYRKELIEQSLPSRMETVTPPVSSDQGPGSGGSTYKVMVQNKHSAGFEKLHEAQKHSDALKEQGLKNVTEPMTREKVQGVDYGLHGGALRAMDHAVDALTHLSNEQKVDLKAANEQASLGLMRGNRLNQGIMAKNRVRGANADPVLAAHDYFSASAKARARSTTQPDIDKAFGEMQATSRDVQDKDTWKRGALTKEMQERAQTFGRDGFTGQMPNYLQNLSTLAYLKNMAAPIHYALDLTHPYLISIPQLAGRHGFGAAHMAFQRALNDMGGRTPTLAKGMKGAWKALVDKDHSPSDLYDGIKLTLKSNGATDQELRALDQARETNALHSVFTDLRPHFDKTGKVNTALQRAQSVGQEMSAAVDNINRIATFLSGYRLERAKMGKPETRAQEVAQHAQAIRYAKDNLTQTQGLYTSSNRASFMRDPRVRAAMQFRSVPMMIYKVMARNVYQAFKGETPDVRWAAVRSLLGTMGTTSALAGAAAGVPEPIRLAVMLTHMFGLTDSWQDEEDKMTRATDAALGKFGSKLVMHGILGAAGLNVGNRIGLNDLFIKDHPQSSKEFLFDNFVGAPGENASEMWDAGQKVMAGDYRRGIPGLIPIRLFSDIAKAYTENQGGKPAKGNMPPMAPLDPYETFIRAMGGTPTREADYNKMGELSHEASVNRQEAIKQAAGGNTSAMSRWNLQHPRNRINQSHVLKAKQSNKGLTPRQKQTAEEYSAYQ